MTPVPGTTPTLSSNTTGVQADNIIKLLAGYAHTHRSLRRAATLTRDTSIQESIPDTDLDPDMLPHE